MRILIILVVLLCNQAQADTKILINKVGTNYIITPDCFVPEDVTLIKANRLRVGAPLYVRHNGKLIRCEIEDFYQLSQ